MLIPYHLQGNHDHGFIDPLSSDRCEIELQISDYCEPIGGYYLLDIENLPAIPVSKIDHAYSKILNILGIYPQ